MVVVCIVSLANGGDCGVGGRGRDDNESGDDDDGNYVIDGNDGRHCGGGYHVAGCWC